MFSKQLSIQFVLVASLAMHGCGSNTSQSGVPDPQPDNTNDAGSAGQPNTDQRDASGAGQSDTSADAGTGPSASDSGRSSDAASNGDSDPHGAANSDASDGSTTTGTYACTFNATGTYPLGGEHRGYVIFGTVIDTTSGAGRARVGAFQNALDTNDQIKFTWPGILTAGHTYEVALFEDHAKNRTCAGDPGGGEAQWLFPVPAVTGDFTFNFTHNPRVASCQDFPAGPIP